MQLTCCIATEPEGARDSSDNQNAIAVVIETVSIEGTAKRRTFQLISRSKILLENVFSQIKTWNTIVHDDKSTFEKASQSEK